MQASAGSKADAVESFASLRHVAAELAATAREVRAESVAVIEEAVALRRDTVALLAAIVLAKRLRDDALRVGILLEGEDAEADGAVAGRIPTKPDRHSHNLERQAPRTWARGCTPS